MTKKTETNVSLVKYKEQIFAASDLAKKIVEVEKDGIKLKYKLHNVALSIITHWGKKIITGQEAAEYFTKLGKAAGYHGKPLANWVSVKTPLKYSDESKAWYAPPDTTVNGDTFKAARDEPFWELDPPKEPKPFDALKMLEAVLAKNLNKQAHPEKVQEGDHLMTPELAQALRKAIADEKKRVASLEDDQA
jgi:hypothetical protein